MFLIAGLSRLARAVLASRSAAGELAAANLGSSPVRNSVAVASLMIAIAMTVAVAILISSFRTTVVAWADDTADDLFVRPMRTRRRILRRDVFAARRSTVARLPESRASIDVRNATPIPFADGYTNLTLTTDLARFRRVARCAALSR